jgi:O-antigen/teichoic acid export membrane protein
MTAKNLSQQFVSATFWNTLLFPARLVVGLVASVIYYRYLSLDQVGVLFLLQSTATTIGLYADLGIERSLPRFLPEAERQGGRAGVQQLMRRVIRLKLLVLLVLIVGLAAFTGPLSRALVAHEQKEIAAREARLAQLHPGPREAAKIEKSLLAKKAVVAEIATRERVFLTAVGLLLILGALFDVYMQFLTAYLKQRSWNLITLASTLLQPLLVTSFILAGWGISGVLLGLVLAPLVSVLLARWQVARARGELGPPAGTETVEDGDLNRRFARFAAVNYLMQATTWTYEWQALVFLSAATLSLEDAALLGFSYKFAKDLLGYVWTPLIGIMVPVLSRVHTRRDPAALREAHASLTRIIWLLELPAAVALLVLAPRALEVFYPRYATTTLFVDLFIVFLFADSLAGVPYNVLMVTERYRPVIAAQVVALSGIPLVLLLLPRYGLLGVVVAAGLARLFSRAVTVVAGMRRLGLDFPFRFGSRVLLASGAMAAGLLAILRFFDRTLADHRTGTSFLVLALASSLGFLIFILALKALGGIHDEERRRLASLPLPFRGMVFRIL